MKLPDQPLGSTRKPLALLIIVIGLATLFMPMVILTPPLLGRAEWTPLAIAHALVSRQLPAPGGHFDDVVIEMGLIYVLLVASLFALLLRSPKVLTIICTLGVAASSTGNFWRHGFMYIFGWYYWGPGRMKIGTAWWILPWIMVALLAVCFAKSLDIDEAKPEEAAAPSSL